MHMSSCLLGNDAFLCHWKKYSAQLFGLTEEMLPLFETKLVLEIGNTGRERAPEKDE